jgi:hypothetical protein
MRHNVAHYEEESKENWALPVQDAAVNFPMRHPGHYLPTAAPVRDLIPALRGSGCRLFVATAVGSAQIDDARFAVLGAERQHRAVRVPGKRRDRRVARAFGHDLGAVLDTHEQREAVRKP